MWWPPVKTLTCLLAGMISYLVTYLAACNIAVGKLFKLRLELLAL